MVDHSQRQTLTILSEYNLTTFSNQKFWCVTLSLHKNDQTKNSTELEFKTYHQKGMFFVSGKFSLFSFGRIGSSTSSQLPPLSSLSYAPAYRLSDQKFYYHSVRRFSTSKTALMNGRCIALTVCHNWFPAICSS